MKRILTVLFGLLILAVTLIAYLLPYYDWDLAAYVGSAIALNQRDSKLVQQQAYAALRTELPEDDYTDIASGSDFRRDVAHNADHFCQQLRFYQIRPLYLWTLAGLHAIGIGFVHATRIISAIAFSSMAVLLFCWLRHYVSQVQAGTCAMLLLITPVILTSARTGSPDAFSALIVLLGTYLLIERNAALTGGLLLLLSLFLRTDNVLFVFIVCAAVAYQSAEKRTRVITAVAAIVSIGLVLAINQTEHSYRWSVLLENTATPIVNPSEVSPRISMSDYFRAVHDMVDEARENSVTVFPFIAALALFAWRTPPRLRHLVTLVLLSWAAHLVLFPHIEDRYFIAGAAMIGVAVVAGLLSSKTLQIAPRSS